MQFSLNESRVPLPLRHRVNDMLEAGFPKCDIYWVASELPTCLLSMSATKGKPISDDSSERFPFQMKKTTFSGLMCGLENAICALIESTSMARPRESVRNSHLEIPRMSLREPHCRPGTCQINPSDIFWEGIAPSDHWVQIYNDDARIISSLAGFAGVGLRQGEAVIVIATQAHIEALDAQLMIQGLDVAAARQRNQYLSRDAEDTLSQFMVGEMPDEFLFQAVVADLLGEARRNHCRVRAFGEMVALLWAKGQRAATMNLEHLWHRYCQEEQFSLFCGYPRIGFTQDADASIREICAAHSSVVA